MKVLVIRFARFGDVVLLLPALAYLKAALPACHLTVLTDHRLRSLVDMCPAVDAVLTVDRLQMRDGAWGAAIRNIGRLVRDLRRHRFDAVIDCHSFRETNLLAWLTGAPQRIGLKRSDQAFLGFCFNRPPVPEDKRIHVAEMFQRLAGAFAPNGPARPSNEAILAIPIEAQEWARARLPSPPFVALYVDAPVKERMWPIERFAHLADHLCEHWGVEVVVLSFRAVRQEFRSGVRTLTDLSIPQLAAAIARARMLVSNDTGPMHLGPALGVPTLGLFSVGIPLHFRPTGPRDAYLQECPIEKLELEKVIDSANRLLKASAG